MANKQIYVTQPYLPPLKDFIPYLEKIWENKVLTNNGPFHRQFEEELCEYLNVEYVSLFTNGTIALLTALQALRITGEVITTPYSFVATSHSLLWNKTKPVFVDVNPVTCNINVDLIESAITSQTTAIMPVHCYGNPCDVEAIKLIAEKHRLKVIYDAAHAFGVKYKDQSLLNYGDLSVLSFHATKVFNTFEGGAIVCKDAETKQRIDHLKNFGFTDEITVIESGINGKMSEINAAFGLLQLKHIDSVINVRQDIMSIYRQGLSDIKGVQFIEYPSDTVGNASYCPILVGNEFPLTRDELYDYLKKAGINARRYFYPLISDFPMYRSAELKKTLVFPVAKSLASQVLCLPIYPSLSREEQELIIKLIRLKSLK